MITRVRDRARARVSDRRAPHVEDPPVVAGGGGAPIYALTDAAAISTYLQGLKSPAIADDLSPAEGFNFDGGTPPTGGQVTVAGFIASAELSADYNSLTVATAHGFGAPTAHGVAGDLSDAAAWEAGDTSLFAFGDAEAFVLLARAAITAAPSDATRGLLGRGALASPHYGLMVNTDGTLTVRIKTGFGGPPTTATLAGSVADGVPRWLAMFRSITGATFGVARAGVAAATSALAGTGSPDAGTGRLFTLGDIASGSTPPFNGGPTAVIDHLLGFRGASAEALIANLADILAGLEAAES